MFTALSRYIRYDKPNKMKLSRIPVKKIVTGYHAKLLHSKTMTLVLWDVEQGVGIPRHHHVHKQIMHVIELDSVTKSYQGGDIVPIAPNLPHSGKA